MNRKKNNDPWGPMQIRIREVEFRTGEGEPMNTCVEGVDRGKRGRNTDKRTDGSRKTFFGSEHGCREKTLLE